MKDIGAIGEKEFYDKCRPIEKKCEAVAFENVEDEVLRSCLW